jgi:hypothetical protein
MEGILIPIVGLMTSVALGLVCALIPRLRSYVLPALVAPFVTSVVFLFGCFILADMNPAREYGAAYVSTGKEHDPTRVDYILLFAAVCITSVVSSGAAYLVQRAAVGILRESTLGQWLINRGHRPGHGTE